MSTVEIQGRELSSRNRPILFAAPNVGAHIKDTHGRLAINPVFSAFQVVIEPGQLAILQNELRLGPEIDVAIFLAGPMSPRSDDHARFAARSLASATLPHACVAVNGPCEKNIEPSAL